MCYTIYIETNKEKEKMNIGSLIEEVLHKVKQDTTLLYNEKKRSEILDQMLEDLALDKDKEI